jgi:hypothetical protein
MLRRLAYLLCGLPAGLLLLALAPFAQAGDNPLSRPNCDENAANCAEPYTLESPAGYYLGHDEPSLLFYDSTPGSGNSPTYHIRLPTEPAQQPAQNGANGVAWDFELRATYWFGMILCDSQSAPEYTHAECTPDSDTNIHNNNNPNSPRYIGKQPGNAYMELQLYPPGWVPWPAGNGCPGTKWCAAMNIFSFNNDENHGIVNNADCLSVVGEEPANFAFLTLNGHPHASPDPISIFTDPHAAAFTPDPTTDLQLNPGDELVLCMQDTVNGLYVQIHDVTTGQTGAMTASAANGFAQVNFAPNATTCSETPYSFHPMFATSRPATRSVWAAHSYNVAASDEIGHFEWCDKAAADFTCKSSSTDPGGADGDEFPCFPSSFSSLVPVVGCIAINGDLDFDGPPYQSASWPGAGGPASNTPTSIAFTSPTFGGGQNYHRVAFEADLPRIEAQSLGGTCNRQTGGGCVNPPPGAQFYPFYTTGTDFGGQCVWWFGGGGIPGTTHRFGGSSTSEFGGLQQLSYPGNDDAGNPKVTFKIENFHRSLKYNPCTV